MSKPHICIVLTILLTVWSFSCLVESESEGVESPPDNAAGVCQVYRAWVEYTCDCGFHTGVFNYQRCLENYYIFNRSYEMYYKYEDCALFFNQKLNEEDCWFTNPDHISTWDYCETYLNALDVNPFQCQ